MTLSFRDKSRTNFRLMVCLILITILAAAVILQMFAIGRLANRVEALETFSDNSSRVLFALYTRVKKYEPDMPDLEDLPEEDPAIAIEPL